MGCNKENVQMKVLKHMSPLPWKGYFCFVISCSSYNDFTGNHSSKHLLWNTMGRKKEHRLACRCRSLPEALPNVEKAVVSICNTMKKKGSCSILFLVTPFSAYHYRDYLKYSSEWNPTKASNDVSISGSSPSVFTTPDLSAAAVPTTPSQCVSTRLLTQTVPSQHHSLVPSPQANKFPSGFHPRPLSGPQIFTTGSYLGYQRFMD